MKKEYIVELREEEADELMNEHWVGELVRCKDCKHQDPERFNDGSGCFVCRKGHGWKPDDWFCADGERKIENGYDARVCDK